MFVDELTVEAKAGDGGAGVVRWLRLKFRPKAGPAGGNGGNGGDVYVRGVRDVNRLAKYTGNKKFIAQSGEPGRSLNQYGKNGDDLYIDVPVGSVVLDVDRGRRCEITYEGETVRMLKGGNGGLGNLMFKSSINRSPEQATTGTKGEAATLEIEVKLMVAAGLVGLPNAGKSTLLNALTNATAQVGSYPFTTLEPHLGDLYGYILADIPGLIAGAAEGKGLGHKFLRHITRTKMLLHCVALDSEDPLSDYRTVRNELFAYEKSIHDKEEWIIFTKMDLVNKAVIDRVSSSIDITKNRVFFVSAETGEGIKNLSESLVRHLQEVTKT